MSRPLKEIVFLRIARELAALGTCDRAYVGAIIVKDGRCISWGYNGAPPGLPHCGENDHGWGVVDDSGSITIRELQKYWDAELSEAEVEHMPWDYKGGVAYLAALKGCRNVTHAEANALAYAARQGISTDGGTCVVTLAPCVVCARLLIAAGILWVVYGQEYRDMSGIELLKQAGLTVTHFGN